jgi:hypothetical protein
VKPKKGAAKFFKTLFTMCKQSYDVNSKALRLAQSNHDLIREDFNARGLEMPEDPPEMAPIAHFNYLMPSLDDAMFAGGVLVIALFMDATILSLGYTSTHLTPYPFLVFRCQRGRRE